MNATPAATGSAIAGTSTAIAPPAPPAVPPPVAGHPLGRGRREAPLYRVGEAGRGDVEVGLVHPGVRGAREVLGRRGRPPTGTVYPALHRLERAGLIAGDWQTVGGRRRRAYHLTPAGHAALGEHRAVWDQFSAAVAAVLSATRPRPAPA